MAEQKQASDKENNRAASADSGKRPSSGGGLVEAVLIGAAIGVAKLWNAVTADGVLAASVRQGIDELGAALKAFPESIQVQETGTLWNPTQGEIAADRQQEQAARPAAPVAVRDRQPKPAPAEQRSRQRARERP